MASPFPRPTGKTALLVEPGYPSKLPSIGLLKISTYLKGHNISVQYVKGRSVAVEEPDMVFVTTGFTFDWEDAIEDTKFYLERFPSSMFHIGGVYASLMPEHVEKHLGITPSVGTFEEVDECPPDYSLVTPCELRCTSHIFTSRGCPHSCRFCGTRKVEPDMRTITGWKGHLHPSWRHAVLHDNNVLAHGDEHFRDILSTLRERRIMFMFDNGFDCRLFERQHASWLEESSISEVRFAFDSLSQDGELQVAIDICKRAGISPRKIKVFILYNFHDDLEGALYRAQEVHRLGARPWAMRYMPLRWLNPGRQYIDPNWDVEDLFRFHSYVNRFGIMRRFTYREWKDRIKRPKIAAGANVSAKRDVVEAARARAIRTGDAESLVFDESFIKSYFDEAP